MQKRIAIAIELDHPWPWHLDCYQGILQYGAEHDWICVVDPYLVGTTGQSGVKDYDGVVGRITNETAQSAAEQGIPVVNHWRNTPTSGLPSVFNDYHEGARLAGEHLVSCGYRRFAHMGIITHAVSRLDFAGLTEAVRAHGFPDPDTFEFPNDFESSREGVIHMRSVLTSWLKGLTSPVGVLSQTSVAARYLAQICSEMGLKVPEDVGIVVQLGDNVLSLAASPTLTMVDSDDFVIGYESAKMLDRLMAGEQLESQIERVTPSRLIVRESSDFYLSSDPLVTEAMRYIADHCRETLRVEDLADALNTSRRTLERRFEEVVGRSVYSEVARLRAEYVKRYLLDTDQPLSAIARDCGFSSASHFTRFFSNVVGMTPSAYRKDQSFTKRKPIVAEKALV
ncbi:MAG: helix-turn-helix domain-containing protein [Phycisphaeraceae bacterium]